MSSAVHSSRVALLGVTRLCSYVSTHLKDVEIHWTPRVQSQRKVLEVRIRPWLGLRTGHLSVALSGTGQMPAR